MVAEAALLKIGFEAIMLVFDELEERGVLGKAKEAHEIVERARMRRKIMRAFAARSTEIKERIEKDETDIVDELIKQYTGDHGDD